MHEFEQAKKNNLILYGIRSQRHENAESLRQLVGNVLRDNLTIRRELPVTRATRIHTGTVHIKRILRLNGRIMKRWADGGWWAYPQFELILHLKNFERFVFARFGLVFWALLGPEDNVTIC